MAMVRGRLLRLARRKGCKGWNVMPVETWAVGFVEEGLSSFSPLISKALGFSWKSLRVSFPWHRAFEIRLELT
jgi:hypothetical protein